MGVLFSTILTSVLSFSLGNIWNRWKSTKQQRIERKESKLKEKAIKLMDSKELLLQAKQKDEENYKRLKGDNNEN